LVSASLPIGRQAMDKQKENCRPCSHAGSWYSADENDLRSQLEDWLSAVKTNHGPAKAIISPHAGYCYCGASAAYAYKQIDPNIVDRIFILGPSHHVCLSGCAVSKFNSYGTPFYNLTIDQQVNSELIETGLFEKMELITDTAEHSIEMQLPYIAHVMQSRKGAFTIVPILVGSLTPSRQSAYGHILSRYLADDRSLFIISTDFCHWGHRFHFTKYDKTVGEIHSSIERLDREGMKIIESLDSAAFNDYLKRTGNTICGRHPISVLLQATEHLHEINNHRADFRFLHYSQSNHCRSMHDSSVSYAAGSLMIKPT
ncbi:Protein MEMO1, partial [Trichinella pseudospiralis]